MSKNYLNIWKELGLVNPNQTSTGSNIKVLCPHHEDSEASFRLDFTNEDNKGSTDNYHVGKCWTCQSAMDNMTPERFWLKFFADVDYGDSEYWKKSRKLINSIMEFENSEAYWKNGRLESRNYEDVLKTVETIFDIDYLDEYSPEWEDILASLINNGDLYVTKQNEHVPQWSLTFAVGFGQNHKVGEVAYHPKAANKVTTSKGTKNGIFMPWSIKENAEFKHNFNKEHTTNLLANPQKRVLIVEGQKDMLACRLLGLPAITITGGCKQLALHPELFLNKDVYIVYDNDSAGYEGAKNLGLQLLEVASSVRVSTSFYKDMEEKEDAFDFFFKYKKTPDDFIERLDDPENFEIYDFDTLTKIEKERSKEAYKKYLKKKAVNLKTFYQIYELPMHKLFEINARLNTFEVQASHNIYKKVDYEIFNYGDLASPENAAIWNRVVKIIETAEENEELAKKFEFTFSQRKITITAEIGDDNMDIIEDILLETSISTDKHYAKLFKEIHRTYKNIVASADKTIKSNFVQSMYYHKESAIDYTEMFIAQDRDFEELSKTKSDTPQVYSVFMPSGLIKPNSKSGDKLTLICGKLKKHKTNQPYLLGFDLAYRNPIDDFKLTDEIKESMDKFRLVPSDSTTVDDIKAKMHKMYNGMRMLADDREVYSEMLWKSIELTWSSIRMYRTANIQNNFESNRGVLDILMIGDSGTGKSNTVERFINTYGTGVVQEMSKATLKGLVGGADIGNKNKINIGLLPMNDGGLVSFEELSGLESPEARKVLFNDLLELRWKGSTLVTRVSDKVEVTAHTRLITASNPVDISENQVALTKFNASSYWSAVELLIPNVAALNRFTFFHFPTKQELKEAKTLIEIQEEMNNKNPFEQKDWANKVKWIWSRKEEDVTIQQDISVYASEQTLKVLAPLLETEGSDVGLFSSGRSTTHVINTAIAIAASTLSTVDYQTLLVKKVHVDAAIDWFKSLYHEGTGIPQMVAKRNKASVASDDDIEYMMGRKLIGSSHTLFEKALTFGTMSTPQAKELLFDLYSELNSQMTDASGGNQISWKLIEPYLIGLSKQAIATGEAIDENGRALQSAWRLALKKIGVIREHPTKDRIFIIQPKFLTIFSKIKEEINQEEV